MTGSSTIDATGTATAEDRAASAYARVGGAAAVDEMIGRFHRLVFGDGDLRSYFGADVTELHWHQVAQLTRALGGPDRYRAAGESDVYLPMAVQAELYHRSAFYLVRAMDCAAAPRDVIASVALALAARRCRIVGRYPIRGVPTWPTLVSVEGPR